MTPLGDYPIDMDARAPLDDRTVEGLLAGRPPQDPGLENLATFVRALKDIERCSPQPTAALADILAHGVAPAHHTRPPVTAPAAAGSSRGWSRRLGYVRGAPSMLGAVILGLVGKLAGLGVAAKTALVLTTAAGLAAGAATTDLPRTISDALHRAGDQAPADLPVRAGEAATDVGEEAIPPPRPHGSADDDGKSRLERSPADQGQIATPPEAPPDGDHADGPDGARPGTSERPAAAPAQPGPGAGRRSGGPPAGPPAGAPDPAPAGAPRPPPAGAPDPAPAQDPGGPPANTPASPPADAPAEPSPPGKRAPVSPTGAADDVEQTSPPGVLDRDALDDGPTEHPSQSVPAHETSAADSRSRGES